MVADHFVDDEAQEFLAEIGIELRDDQPTMLLYKSAGAEVTPQTDGIWRVKFPPGMLREILKTAPEVFTQHARNPSNNVQIGGNNVVFAPSYGSPFVMDLDRGRRYGTIEDFRNFIKLSQSSPWLHHSGGTVCEPTDVPVNKRHLDMVYSHIRYSDRAFLGSITAPERAADSVEMARILFGAPDAVTSRTLSRTTRRTWSWSVSKPGAVRIALTAFSARSAPIFAASSRSNRSAAAATLALREQFGEIIPTIRIEMGDDGFRERARVFGLVDKLWVDGFFTDQDRHAGALRFIILASNVQNIGADDRAGL